MQCLKAKERTPNVEYPKFDGKVNVSKDIKHQHQLPHIEGIEWIEVE